MTRRCRATHTDTQTFGSQRRRVSVSHSSLDGRVLMSPICALECSLERGVSYFCTTFLSCTALVPERAQSVLELAAGRTPFLNIV